MGEVSRHVLVVDDDATVLAVIVDLLECGGHTAESALSGPKAIEILKAKGAFDYLFTDMEMPEMTGWDLAAYCSQHFPEMPIVLITGWMDEMENTLLLDQNIQHVLTKPVKIDQLNQILNDCPKKS